MSNSRESDFLKAAFDARPVLTAYAYSILKDWGLAQDVFQDAVISMNEKHAEIKSESPLKWLKSVIKFKAVDLIRKQQRTEAGNDQFQILLEKKFDAFLTSEKIQEYKEKEQALHSCMAKLDEEQQQIILGFYKSRYSCSKLAEMFKKSTNAIRLILSRSRAGLRHCVKQQLEQQS